MYANKIKPLMDKVTAWNAKGSPADQCPLPNLKTCKRYIRAIFESYREFSKMKIAHCDMKPENLLLGTDGLPRISDLGFCEQMESSLGELKFNQGSVPYMCCGRLNSQRVTRFTDLWAIGVICYELVTGKYPFDMNDIGGSVWNYTQLIPKDDIGATSSFMTLNGSEEFKFQINRRDRGFEDIRDLIANLLQTETRRIGFGEDHLHSIFQHPALQEESTHERTVRKQKAALIDRHEFEKVLRGFTNDAADEKNIQNESGPKAIRKQKGIVAQRLELFKKLWQTKSQPPSNTRRHKRGVMWHVERMVAQQARRM